MGTNPRGSGPTWLALALALLFVAAPAALSAQSTVRVDRPGGLSFDARAGVVVPGSNLSDLYKVGPAAGLGASYWFTDRVGLTVNADLDILNGKDAGAAGITSATGVPRMRQWHFTGGVIARLTDPDATRWDITADVGAGLTRVDTNNDPAFAPGGIATAAQDSDFTKSYFGADGGVQIGYDVRPDIDVYVGGRANLVAMKKEDTQIFSNFSTSVDPAGFGSTWTFPVRAGLRFTF